MDTPAHGQELAERLGPARLAALEEELRRRAVSFASDVAAGSFHAAGAGQRLSEAVERVFAEGAANPLLVIWPCLTRLGRRHAREALDDLASGVDVVLGPVIDGGLYLLGLGHPAPDLLAGLDESLESGEEGMLGLAAASELGLEIGLLRVERAVLSAADVEAALADPLTPESIRRVLAGPR